MKKKNEHQLFLNNNRIKYRGNICFNSQYKQQFTLTLACKVSMVLSVLAYSVIALGSKREKKIVNYIHFVLKQQEMC